ncbi:uncharacterized protein LOC131658763 [Vicia villosa]|uniref:uncharacterized protein LOC131658763 n=1 Tax=Vicia villosa TaxID=3911 RepID=UPI00273BE1B7|nr:uncharacterized protein LOC131658763 [Vicia villosa]
MNLKTPFKSKKLSPKFVGPYQIIEQIGKVAFRLALPPSRSGLHDVFHVSQLRKFIPDSFHPILPDAAEVETDLSFQPHPNCILDYSSKKLRHKEIPMVKVLWDNSSSDEATWELESEMQSLYFYLFW